MKKKQRAIMMQFHKTAHYNAPHHVLKTVVFLISPDDFQ